MYGAAAIVSSHVDLFGDDPGEGELRMIFPFVWQLDEQRMLRVQGFRVVAGSLALEH